jgi:uncharacterized membrane protein YuzA (DUF378 family)
MNNDRLATIWLVVGFASMIGLVIENSTTSTIAYLLLGLTIGSFVLALHFVMKDYEKKEKSEAKK